MYRIMIVEDDRSVAEPLRSVLQSWGFEADIAENFENLTAEFQRIRPDLILMDLYQPDKNGFYWTSEIRKISSLPIIFLSSADENMNVLTALTKGADDYITKPFDTAILVTKIQALLRRTYDYSPKSSVLEHRGVRFDADSLEARHEDQCVVLSKNEGRIMKILLEHKGQVVSRETLMEALWKTDCYIDENTLSVNVNRLRKKLEVIHVTDFIETRKGLGYTV